MNPFEEPELKPNVQIIQGNFWVNKKVKIALVFGFIALLSLIILNYFNFISLPVLFLPKANPTNFNTNPVKVTLIPENYGFKAGELTLSCPIESAFCNSQRLININQNSAVSYKAASNSAVSSSLEINSLENIGVLENKKTGKKYFYESTVSKDGKSCYTIAYTLPQDATFKNILDLKTLMEYKKFATLGSQTFKIEGTEANVLIQVRNTPMDAGTPCSLIRKSPEFFKFF